jgi:hypothetical protein
MTAVAARRPSAIAATVAATGLAAGLLTLPAVWNGSPFYYWDSVDYVYLPFTWELPIYRTVSYGVFAGIGRMAGSLWAVVAVQALLVAWMLRETLAVFWPGNPDRALVPLTLLLTLLTGLSWSVGTLMPDALTGLVVLGLACLAFDRGELGRRRLPLAAITAIAVAVHTSHVALSIGLVAALALVALGGRRLRLGLRPRIVLPASCVVAAIVMVIGAHWLTTGRPMLTQPTSMLFLARLVQDGIAKRFLDDHCVDGKPYLLCPYKDRLPPTANEFLWQANSIPQQLQGWERLGPEAAEIVVRSLHDYPWLHLAAAGRLTVQQIVKLRTGDGLLPGVGWFIDDPLHRYYPAGHAAFLGSHQRAGIDFVPVNAVHVPAAALTLVLTLAALGWAWRRGERRALAITLVVVIALAGNALICGALSNPNDRYQSRIVWLAVVATAIAGARIRETARLPGRSAQQRAESQSAAD